MRSDEVICRDAESAPPECPWRSTCPTPNAKFDLSGTEGSSPQLLSGWHQDDVGQSLWSKQGALMVIRNPGPRSRISVSGTLPASSHGAKNTLRIYCNGFQLGDVVNYSETHLSFRFSKLLPPSSDGLLHLRFLVSDPYCPSENGVSSDRRSLGFALFHVLAARPRSATKSLLADLATRVKDAGIDRLARVIARWIQSGRTATAKSTAEPSSDGASGLSVIVIDNKDPGALERCLSSICASAGKMSEPVEILLVSGVYRGEALSFLPAKLSPRWIEVKGNCTFSHAFRTGMSKAGHKWAYVIDSRFSLDESTLPESLKWRAPHVFAVGSIVQGGRSWRGAKVRHGLAAIEYRELDAESAGRGAWGVSPGCSLFNRALLLELWGKRDVYDSPDWANLEWCIRSWRMGWETILCPASRVRSYSEACDQRPAGADVEALRFLLRNTFPHAADLRDLISKALHSRLGSCADLLNPVALASYRASRSLERAFPFDETVLDSVHGTYYINPDKNKPALIFASPYALFPPSHGSAVGMSYLLRALRERFSVHILTDECEAYADESLPCFEPFATVRLLSGRKEDPDKLHDRIARIESHSRPEMREALRLMVSAYRPRFVEIEHVELAKLIQARGCSSAKWVLNLHDVFLSDKAPGASAEDRYELDLMSRFDALICCSSEDAALLGKSNVTIVPNGVELRGVDYEPSPPIPRMLFIGPWRSPQNIPGILDFLEHVYPLLLPRFANLELWYLGGKGVHELVDRDPRFRQRGIEIFEYVDDVQEMLGQCALTINPISGNRGSCRKVVESLAAGRVCVSTREGARGYLELGIPSLLTCDKVQDFEVPILTLLENVDYRRSLERLDDDQRHKLSWEHSQARLLALYAALGIGDRLLNLETKAES